LKHWIRARLEILVALIFLGSLAFWSAENLWSFKAALIATEYGEYLVLPCLLLAFLPARRSSIILGLIAAALFASTDIRAWRYQQDLPERFQAAFGSPWETPPRPLQSFKIHVFSYDSVRNLKLRFWRVTGATDAPCVIVVHGGGWNAGSRDEFPDLNAVLASEGFAVASIDYRLSPENPWPAQYEDVMNAKNWLQRQAKSLGIDPKRFAILGRSAGAQIALAAAYKNKDAFKGVIDFYGPADLRFAWAQGYPGDILDSLSLLKDLTGGSPDEKAAIYDDASPYSYASKDSPPTLILHGVMDRLVWNAQSERLNEKLDQMGQKKHLFISLPWAVHAFDYNLKGPGGRISEKAVEAFLQNIFNPELK